MNDDSIVKVMQSLDLNFSPAVLSVMHFEKSIKSLNQQLAGMKAIAMQSAKDINNAFSSQLGQVAGSKTIVDQYGAPFKSVQSLIDNTSKTAANGFKSISDEAKKHVQSVEDVRKQYNIFDSEMSRRTSWFLSGGLFYGALKGSKEAISTISDVEMGMVEISRVMEDSTFKFKDYRDQLLQFGVDYGQTFDTVQDIALRWAQAGYGVKDSLENTKTSLLALNTAELDAKNSTESLIGIMAQWDLKSKDLPLLLDEINKTADDYTVTSKDLIEGLLKSSEVSKNFGLTLEQNIALLTIMREASGAAGKEIGNALKSILIYTQRDKSINVFKSLGISSFTDELETKFRPAWDIFHDIASKWDTASTDIQDGFIAAADDVGLMSDEISNLIGMEETWTDVQKRDIAQGAAGAYRRNYFISLIRRLSEAQEVLNNMMDAAGYSMRENANTMDTLEKKYESLKASAEQLAVALGDAGLLDTLKGIVDSGINAAHAFTEIDDEAKALILTALELLAALEAIKAVGNLFGANATIAGAFALPGWTKLLVLIPALVGAVALYAHNLDSASDSTNGLQDKQDKLNKSFNSQMSAIEQSNKDLTEQANKSEILAKKLDELTNKESLNISEKAQLKAITDQLNQSFPDLGLKIDENTGKVIGNTSAIYDNIEALKKQAIQQAYQAKMTATANAYVDQEILLGQTSNELEIARKELSTIQAGYDAQAEKNLREAAEARAKANANIGKGNFNTNSKIGGVIGDYYISDTEKKIIEQKNKVNALNKLKNEQETILNNLDAELKDWVDKTSKTTSGIPKETYVPSVGTPIPKKEKSGSYKNSALDNALKVLDYKKHINEMSVADEIEYLKRIKAQHVNTADELMDINKRIYDAEKLLVDKKLKNSVDWINEKKSLDQLSTEEEIAAWERVLYYQSNNNEAVKQANLNLYKLRKQLNTETFDREKDSIQHLAKISVYNTQEQINQYRKLYEVKASSIKEEQQRIENLFDLYKKSLNEQQNSIKEAYDERIRLIDEEADKEKSKKEEKIKGIEEELKLLDRKDNERSYEQTMSELQKQLAYWQVRTSEDARKKVIEIEKQMQEEQYKHELELKKQGLNDKKDVLEDEIDEIEKSANEEKRKWEKSYKLTEKAFNDHSSNIVALAGAMSKDAYKQWEDNYLIPLKKALASGNFKDFDSISGSLDGSITDLGNNTYNSKNAQIYRLANSILELKRKWTAGDTSAADRAKSYYSDLYSLGGKGKTVADYLNSANYESAKDYISRLPKAHGGGKTLSYGAVYMKPGEYIFPPDLSTKFDGLLNFLKNTTFNNSSTSTTNNKKEIKINTLLNIENNRMEDETDNEIFARELGRMINAL